jgi:TolB protein
MSTAKMQQKPQTATQVDTSYWQKQNVNDVVVGSIKNVGGDRYAVKYELVDLFNRKSASDGVLLSQEFTVSKSALRKLSHHISDQVYQRLTGEKGVFSTKLAYVTVDRSAGRRAKYALAVSDFDGHDAKSIVSSTQPIMSPAWSPDGHKIAYVSFETYLPQIYVSDIFTGQRQLVTNFKGINGAPSWSPDGTKLAVALSRNSVNPNIYILNLASNQLQQITSDAAINTEPSWSPDGQSLIYTSDRGGSPQIYQINLQSRQSQRLTYDGNYNATASYSRDGKRIVNLHRSSGDFNVAILDLQSGATKELTHSGKNQSPSIAPNGKMVVFASEYGGQGVLGIVSVDGKVSLRIPDRVGSVQEPAWSPYLN